MWYAATSSDKATIGHLSNQKDWELAGMGGAYPPSLPWGGKAQHTGYHRKERTARRGFMKPLPTRVGVLAWIQDLGTKRLSFPLQAF